MQNHPTFCEWMRDTVGGKWVVLPRRTANLVGRYARRGYSVFLTRAQFTALQSAYDEAFVL